MSEIGWYMEHLSECQDAKLKLRKDNNALWVKCDELRAERDTLAVQCSAMRAALTECAAWLESRPDYTEGDAATSSTARAALALPATAAERRVARLEAVVEAAKAIINPHCRTNEWWKQDCVPGPKFDALRAALAALEAP